MLKTPKEKKSKLIGLMLLLLIVLPLSFSVLFLLSPCYLFPFFGGDPVKWCNLLKGDPKLPSTLFISGLFTGFCVFLIILYLRKDIFL
ncbi:MAG: hypothetical protein EBR30_15060 [Cytophagia bacterium]|nr:hypothetical protein [Cytophagia bacterium]NBW36304.1 hypothetical protein [Cytophagia bacterium]